MCTETRNWSAKTDEEILEYAAGHGYIGLSPKEIEEADDGFYQHLARRRDSDVFEEIVDRKRREWGEKDDDEILEYAEERGYVGLSPGELVQEDQGLYEHLRSNREHLLDRITERQREDWEGKTDEELFKYAEENEYVGLSPWEIEKQDRGFLKHIRNKREELFTEITERQLVLWSDKDEEEIWEYIEEQNLHGLSPKELEKEDNGFYQHLVNHRHDIFEEITERQLTEWSEKEDYEILEYATRKGYVGLSPSQIEEKDYAFFQHISKRREHLYEQIVERDRISWEEKTDDEIREYVEENELDDVSRGDLSANYSGLYSHLREERPELLDELFKLECHPPGFWKGKEGLEESMTRIEAFLKSEGKLPRKEDLVSSVANAVSRGNYEEFNIHTFTDLQVEVLERHLPEIFKESKLGEYHAHGWRLRDKLLERDLAFEIDNSLYTTDEELVEVFDDTEKGSGGADDEVVGKEFSPPSEFAMFSEEAEAEVEFLGWID